MPLVELCTASCISDAVVIKTVLEAADIRATLVGLEGDAEIWVVPHSATAVPVMVLSEDLARARMIISAKSSR